MVKEASERIETVPAVYETVTERVLVKPAYTTWKKGEGAITKVDNSTGEIMCLVEVPAEYKTVSKRVLKTPATSRKVSIPAEYQTVRVRKLVQPASERTVQIPAEYDTIVKREKVTDSRLEWKSVLCDTNTNADVIASLQRALKMRGYNPGRIDGVLGRETLDAVAQYQRNKGMASGQLTMENTPIVECFVSHRFLQSKSPPGFCSRADFFSLFLYNTRGLVFGYDLYSPWTKGLDRVEPIIKIFLDHTRPAIADFNRCIRKRDAVRVKVPQVGGVDVAIASTQRPIDIACFACSQ